LAQSEQFSAARQEVTVGKASVQDSGFLAAPAVYHFPLATDSRWELWEIYPLPPPVDLVIALRHFLC
jgi:hypothetical protein